MNKFSHIIVLAIAAVFVTACTSEDIDESREPAVRPVKLLTVEEASTRQTGRYPAVIDAAQLSELSFQVSGLLEELTVTQAQEISEGTIIARLDQRDFQASVASAKAQYNNAQAEYARAEKLSKENAISKSVLQQRRSNRNVARAQLDSAEKALSDTVLVAPFTGVVASVPVRQLQTISAGTLVATLIDTSAFEATVNLPASLVAQIENRTDRRAYVLLDAAPSKPIDAEFKEANLIADSTSQTYAITFSFPPPDNLTVLPGMNATVELSSTKVGEEAVKNRVSVPLAAVLSDAGAQYVWVVNSDTMAVSKRGVTIEEGIGETIVVTEGLSPGETIAGAGANYLAEGMQVRPWTQ